MKAHFEMFAAYNTWANRRLYDAAAEMDDAALKAPAGGFFGSLFGTLSHLLIGDQAWMRRFDGEGPVPTSMEGLPHDALSSLRAAREAMDERITGYIDTLPETEFTADMTFSTVTGPKNMTLRRDHALAHFFNHQTHHRGQCHHMLTAAGRDAPPLDLLFYQWEIA